MVLLKLLLVRGWFPESPARGQLTFQPGLGFGDAVAVRVGAGEMRLQRVFADEFATAPPTADGVEGGQVQVECRAVVKCALALGAGGHGWWWLHDRERIHGFVGLKAGVESLVEIVDTNG